MKFLYNIEVIFALLAISFCDSQVYSMPLAEGDKDTVKIKSAHEILKKETAADSTHLLRKFDFINAALANSPAATAHLDFERQTNLKSPFSLTPEELNQIKPHRYDPVADEIRRRYLDIPPTAPLNGIFKSLVDSFKKTPDVKNLPIPRDVEIDVLKVLWAKSRASSSDIYAHLDTVVRVTSEDLQKILAEMSKRGFVARKKISPSHEFNLFGIVQIELSGKNRKNQLYVYGPLVAKENLIKYLDAKRYLAYASAKESASGKAKAYHKYLAKKLNRVVRE